MRSQFHRLHGVSDTRTRLGRSTPEMLGIRPPVMTRSVSQSRICSSALRCGLSFGDFIPGVVQSVSDHLPIRRVVIDDKHCPSLAGCGKVFPAPEMPILTYSPNVLSTSCEHLLSAFEESGGLFPQPASLGIAQGFMSARKVARLVRKEKPQNSSRANAWANALANAEADEAKIIERWKSLDRGPSKSGLLPRRQSICVRLERHLDLLDR